MNWDSFWYFHSTNDHIGRTHYPKLRKISSRKYRPVSHGLRIRVSWSSVQHCVGSTEINRDTSGTDLVIRAENAPKPWNNIVNHFLPLPFDNNIPAARGRTNGSIGETHRTYVEVTQIGGIRRERSCNGRTINSAQSWLRKPTMSAKEGGTKLGERDRLRIERLRDGGVEQSVSLFRETRKFEAIATGLNVTYSMILEWRVRHISQWKLQFSITSFCRI